jgi:hypothetical protein
VDEPGAIQGVDVVDHAAVFHLAREILDRPEWLVVVWLRQGVEDVALDGLDVVALAKGRLLIRHGKDSLLMSGGGRLRYSRHRGNGGMYEYFCCIKRLSRQQGGRCDSRHYSAPQVEQAIAEHYRTVNLTERVREAVWADVRRDADERTAIVQKDIERHQRKIEKLTDNQARLIQLSYQGLVTSEVLVTEQQRLEAEKLQAQRLLEAAELHARDIESALDGALAKTRTPHATYLASTPLERRLLNQTFFERILVGDDGEIHPDPDFQGQGSHNEVMVGETARRANQVLMAPPPVGVG